MADQSGKHRVAAEVGAELISLMLPCIDPELVELMLNRATHSATGGRTDHQGHRDGSGEPQPALQQYVKLLALIRDAGIDPARLGATLGRTPEALRPTVATHLPPIQ